MAGSTDLTEIVRLGRPLTGLPWILDALANYPTIEDAYHRMQVTNPHLTPELALQQADAADALAIALCHVHTRGRDPDLAQVLKRRRR